MRYTDQRMGEREAALEERLGDLGRENEQMRAAKRRLRAEVG